jgi:hypothetical protein
MSERNSIPQHSTPRCHVEDISSLLLTDLHFNNMNGPVRVKASELLSRRVNLRRREFFRTTAALVALPLVACEFLPMSTEATRARRRRQIETDFYASLERCYASVPGSRILIDKAIAALVFPTVVTSDPLTGAMSGDGTLRVTNVFASYYLLTDNGERKHGPGTLTIIFLFNSFDALNRFRDSALWQVSGARVAFPQMLADGQIDTASRPPGVIAMILQGEKLLPAADVAGMYVTPLNF